jgi:hypothetical protein
MAGQCWSGSRSTASTARRIFVGAYDDAPAAERPTYGAPDHRRPVRPLPARRAVRLPTADRRDRGHRGRVAGRLRRGAVHGPVDLAADMEALVLDPCFRGSPIEARARMLGVPVEWHEGRQLRVETLAEHPLFRGPPTVEVGRRTGGRRVAGCGRDQPCGADRRRGPTRSEEGLALRRQVRHAGRRLTVRAAAPRGPGPGRRAGPRAPSRPGPAGTRRPACAAGRVRPAPAPRPAPSAGCRPR